VAHWVEYAKGLLLFVTAPVYWQRMQARPHFGPPGQNVSYDELTLADVNELPGLGHTKPGWSGWHHGSRNAEAYFITIGWSP
jgi:hypothetical protein